MLEKAHNARLIVHCRGGDFRNRSARNGVASISEPPTVRNRAQHVRSMKPQQSRVRWDVRLRASTVAPSTIADTDLVRRRAFLDEIKECR